MTRRWLDPAFFTDEKLAKATTEERLLFVAVIANQDDDGRLLGHPGYLRSIAFPYDDFTIEQVKQMRGHLAEINHNFIIYNNGSDEYIQLRRHARYQRPRYYHPSKYPAPPGWPFEDERENSNAEETARSHESNYRGTAQQPIEQESGNRTATTQLPQNNHEATARYTEDRVGRGKGRGGVESDLDLDRAMDIRMPSASGDAEHAAGTEIKAQSKQKTRVKPRQQETGIFLDMVEQHIGVKFVQRNKLHSAIRALLVKFPEATPEKLFECFKWLKDNDPFCRSRDSPRVIMTIPDKYPEWAAGKLPAFGGKEERHGRPGERRQDTQRDAYVWEETPEPDDTS